MPRMVLHLFLLVLKLIATVLAIGFFLVAQHRFGTTHDPYWAAWAIIDLLILIWLGQD